MLPPRSIVSLSPAVSPSLSVIDADAVRVSLPAARIASWSSNGEVVTISGAWSTCWNWVSVTTPSASTLTLNTTLAALSVLGTIVPV